MFESKRKRVELYTTSWEMFNIAVHPTASRDLSLGRMWQSQHGRQSEPPTGTTWMLPNIILQDNRAASSLALLLQQLSVGNYYNFLHSSWQSHTCFKKYINIFVLPVSSSAILDDLIQWRLVKVKVRLAVTHHHRYSLSLTAGSICIKQPHWQLCVSSF